MHSRTDIEVNDLVKLVILHNIDLSLMASFTTEHNVVRCHVLLKGLLWCPPPAHIHKLLLSCTPLLLLPLCCIILIIWPFVVSLLLPPLCCKLLPLYNLFIVILLLSHFHHHHEGAHSQNIGSIWLFTYSLHSCYHIVQKPYRKTGRQRYVIHHMQTLIKKVPNIMYM